MLLNQVNLRRNSDANVLSPALFLDTYYSVALERELQSILCKYLIEKLHVADEDISSDNFML